LKSHFFKVKIIISYKYFSFTKCNATQNGGGIFITYPPAEFKMQNTIFIQCFAKGDGGGFNLRTYPTHMTELKPFKYCYFENNDAGEGRDARVYNDDCVFKDSPFEYCFSSTETKRLYLYNGEDGYKNNWIPIGTLNRFICLKDSNDTDNNCMNPNEPCETMEYALTLKIEGVHSAIVMKDEYVKDMNGKCFILKENEKLTLRGFDNISKKPVITVSKLFAEVLGLFNCTSFNLILNTSTVTLFEIKTTTSSGGTVFLKNIFLKCKYYQIK